MLPTSALHPARCPSPAPPHPGRDSKPTTEHTVGIPMRRVPVDTATMLATAYADRMPTPETSGSASSTTVEGGGRSSTTPAFACGCSAEGHELGVTVSDARTHGLFGSRRDGLDEAKDEFSIERAGEFLERLDVRSVLAALQA